MIPGIDMLNHSSDAARRNTSLNRETQGAANDKFFTLSTGDCVLGCTSAQVFWMHDLGCCSKLHS